MTRETVKYQLLWRSLSSETPKDRAWNLVGGIIFPNEDAARRWIETSPHPAPEGSEWALRTITTHVVDRPLVLGHGNPDFDENWNPTLERVARDFEDSAI